MFRIMVENLLPTKGYFSSAHAVKRRLRGSAFGA
jgi:hypothetical protein